ncbi:PREDICTED: uncharacterized protein LOC109155061 [Ipomoea nil]|uniref:uncharacterized protein LOC109155061 n=1 Tax=Ipomoea nil TaxID=35883 RepID=UPI00090194B5|nr:PREDICTED: uncharacterized protein LOC109155061 [Ipomoea nil]
MAVSGEAPTSAASPPAEGWYLDIGATVHATPDAGMMTQSEEYGGPDVLRVGNGACLVISRIGHVSIPSISKPLRLSNILHVPSLSVPLLASDTSSNTAGAAKGSWAHIPLIPPSATTPSPGPTSPRLEPTPLAQVSPPLAIEAPAPVRARTKSIHAQPQDREHGMRLRHMTRDTNEPFHALSATTDPMCYSQVLRTKRTADGLVARYKARLVAKGFNQVAGEDFVDTFSPVVKPTTVWMLFSIAVSNGWTLRQLDVHNAFLNGHLAEIVYMKQPPGYEDPTYPGHVCHLQCSLYGLKQAPRALFKKLHDFLLSAGFLASKIDVALFYYASGNSQIFLLVYVDDIIMMGNEATLRCYMTDLLSRSGMVDCKPLATPAAVTQPFMHSPSVDHWGLVKRVLQYIKGTLNYGLRLSPSSSATIHAFSDSDWAGCPIDRKSTCGYAVYLGSNLISWLSRKQHAVARSSTEAEYKALADVSAEVTWVVSLLRELGLHSGQPSTLCCDNLGATYLCANPVFHARTKHVKIDYHFVRDKVASGDFIVNFVSTKDQLADIFTKPLPGPRSSLIPSAAFCSVPDLKKKHDSP